MPYDRKRAEKVIKFIESLKHSKGKWAGKRFKLERWQKEDIIKPLFGTVTKDGKRQFKKAYIEIPRKNGKTELAAGICDYLLYADGEEGAEIYGAADTVDQAALIYKAAVSMIRQNETLLKLTKIIDYRNLVEFTLKNSIYKVIARKASGAHGKDASGVIFDELHTQKDSEFYDVLDTSGGSREEPLFISITTAGYDKQSPCRKEHDYCINNFLDDTNKGWINDHCFRTRPESKLRDPTYFCYIRAADPEADWRDEKTWYQANPALENTKTGEGFRKLSDIRAKALKADRDLSFRNTFKRLYLNVWTDSVTSWIKMERWRRCKKKISEEQLQGQICYGGLDLASTTDIAAFILLFPIGKYLYIKLWAFIPEATIRERSKTDGVPYSEWVQKGLIIPTPGDWIDFNAIKNKILEARSKYKIHSIAYDRWEATQLVQELIDINVDMVPMGQGFASMSAPTKELIKLTLSEKLQHGGDPVLNWASSNLVLKEDPAGNIKPSKKDSTEKIDPMVALIMAIDRWSRENIQKGSVYDKRAEEGKDVLLEVG